MLCLLTVQGGFVHVDMRFNFEKCYKQGLAHASAQAKAYADKTEQHAHGWRHALFRKRFEAYQASLTQSLEQAAQLEKSLKLWEDIISIITSK